MAQIDLSNFCKIEKQRNLVHEKVATTYTVFDIGGVKYVQIDTYGRNGRENPEKISQSIQIDKDVAVELIRILRDEFEL